MTEWRVYETPIAGELLDRLLKRSDGAATDAEDVEEVVPVGLALGGFAGFAFPFFAKGDGAMANLVPREWHAAQCSEAETLRRSFVSLRTAADWGDKGQRTRRSASLQFGHAREPSNCVDRVGKVLHQLTP